ncbi:MAG: hypothetical protein B6U76_11630 [Desulfurococcales archaeon ex4484_217_2]|nr:MAG: hypothetical protein B6U76_11630 [Desulfurococcales archaeon ex4484_217_2]
MPTIHLSVPEAMYRELREVANEFGLQITDMVKIFIKEGLERRLEKKKKLSLSEERIEVLEGEIFRLKDTVDELFRKIEELSDKIEEMKTPIEPEFVETA